MQSIACWNSSILQTQRQLIVRICLDTIFFNWGLDLNSEIIYQSRQVRPLSRDFMHCPVSIQNLSCLLQSSTNRKRKNCTSTQCFFAAKPYSQRKSFPDMFIGIKRIHESKPCADFLRSLWNSILFTFMSSGLHMDDLIVSLKETSQSLRSKFVRSESPLHFKILLHDLSPFATVHMRDVWHYTL